MRESALVLTAATAFLLSSPVAVAAQHGRPVAFGGVTVIDGTDARRRYPRGFGRCPGRKSQSTLMIFHCPSQRARCM